MKFEELELGAEYIMNKVIKTQDVIKFSELSGDNNPVHLDEDFGKQSIFKGRIIHGMIVGSLFSTIIATYLPGPGSIYLNQDLNFLKPIYHDSELELIVKVTGLKEAKKIVYLSTVCKVNFVKVVEGTAIVKCLF